MAELGMGVYCTEVAGWSARWEMRRHRIRIIEVSDRGGATVLVSSSDAGVAPDLAQMRERFPELSQLWDAVRHEYWAAIVPYPRRRSTGGLRR